jgi:mRNA interferase RelE/StbE
MYSVVIEGRAKRDLERLRTDIIKRIDTVLTKLEANPRPAAAVKLTGYDLWRVRIGDYRIIYEIDDKAKRVIVYKIKHRKEAYKSRSFPNN